MNKKEIEKKKKREDEKRARKQFRNWLEGLELKVKMWRKEHERKVREENIKYKIPEEVRNNFISKLDSSKNWNHEKFRKSKNNEFCRFWIRD